MYGGFDPKRATHVLWWWRRDGTLRWISWRSQHGASHRKKCGTRHPQVGNCGARKSASVFTPVNVRCVNKIRHVLSDSDIEQ
jgi:hypothetical protein